MIIDACHNSTLFLYANDSNIHNYVSKLEHCLALQEDTDNTYQWADEWKLKLFLNVGWSRMDEQYPVIFIIVYLEDLFIELMAVIFDSK